MLHSHEDAWQALSRGSRTLFDAARHESGCYLGEDETAALAGALMNLTRVATTVAMAERN